MLLLLLLLSLSLLLLLVLSLLLLLLSLLLLLLLLLLLFIVVINITINITVISIARARPLRRGALDDERGGPRRSFSCAYRTLHDVGVRPVRILAPAANTVPFLPAPGQFLAAENELCHSYPCPCPSQFVEHRLITHGYIMKFVRITFLGRGMGMNITAQRMRFCPAPARDLTRQCTVRPPSRQDWAGVRNKGCLANTYMYIQTYASLVRFPPGFVQVSIQYASDTSFRFVSIDDELMSE